MSGNNKTDTQENDNAGQQPKNTFPRNHKARSHLLVVSSALAILFFISTLVFVAFFTYNQVKNAERAPSLQQNCNTPGYVKSAPTDGAVCRTSECVITAARMISKMNQSADPCVDFNEFACGRFNREALINDGMTGVDMFSLLVDGNNLILKDILAGEMKQGHSSDLPSLQRTYEKCANEAGTDDRAIIYYLNLPVSKEWPSINRNWTGNSFRLSVLTARYAMFKVYPLYSFYADSDLFNSSDLALHLDEPTLGLPREYFSRPRSDTVIMAYQKYLTNVAVELGAPRVVADQDAESVVDLEIALSEIAPAKEDTLNDTKNYNPILLKELLTLYPELDVASTLRVAFGMLNMELPEDEVVIVHYPNYMANISRVISQFPHRTAQNLFAIKYALQIVEGSNKRMLAIHGEFQKVLKGVRGYLPRAVECMRFIASKYSSIIDAEFMSRMPMRGSKTDIEAMATNLKRAFHSMVEESTWLEATSKDEIYKKIAAIQFEMISLEEDNPLKQLEDEAHVKFSPQKNNTSAGNEFRKKLRMNKKRINKIWGYKNTRHRRGIAVYDFEASMWPNKNKILFTTGVLQPPFFSNDSQNYINYGALGVIYGHEMIHGFDNHGSQYDEKGNLRNWWYSSDKDTFVQRLQCIIDQTSDTFAEEIQMHLNGVYTQGECVADNSGLKMGFRAYKDLVREKGEEPRLPVLNLTQDQLFFLSYSQLWCEKSAKEFKTYLVNTDKHLPGKYRIIGPLQNSEDFAKAFNCPSGSYMNPEKKCSVW